MSKRRKVWWIVGGVLGFVLLYSAAALLVTWNSPDARLERALQEIITENSMVPASSVALLPIASSSKAWSNDSYVGAPISEENGTRILEQLKEACPFCTATVEMGGGGMNPTYNIQAFYASEDSSFEYFAILFDDKGVNLDSPVSELLVVRKIDQSRWSFLKNLWPW